jgi:hypothetical protein
MSRRLRKKRVKRNKMRAKKTTKMRTRMTISSSHYYSLILISEEMNKRGSWCTKVIPLSS